MKKRIFALIVLAAIVGCSSAPKKEVPPKTDTTEIKKVIQNIKLNKKKISTLEDALKSGLPVVAKLGRDTCPPCHDMIPIMKQLKKETIGTAIILDIDIDSRIDLAEKYKVHFIPTILFFDKRGDLKTSQAGFMSKEQILKKMNALNLYQ
jgi:thiol-disulfide isomerase/thioredoxin